jgi:hypothetical protein
VRIKSVDISLLAKSIISLLAKRRGWQMAHEERPTIYVAGGRASGFVAQAIKSEADRTGARVIGKLDLPRSVPPIAPDMLARVMRDERGAGGGQQAPSSRDKAWMQLRMGAPKRGEAGKPVEQQQDVGHLPLFIHANEPKFI